MNKEECEKIYGKLIKETEDAYYFEGKGRFGVTIPKNTYFIFQYERSYEIPSIEDDEEGSLGN